MPPFPPKGLPGLGLVLGQELVVRRIATLQRYFESALARDDVARAPDFQSLLGVQRPQPVRSVKVRRWLNGALSSNASVEIDVVTSVDQDSNGPVDEYLVTARAEVGTPPVVSRGPEGKPLCVNGLPTGVEVALEVRALNGVGTSDAVVVSLSVPGRRAVPLLPGTRVRAVWAGDGSRYDASVQSMGSNGLVVVNWLRPAPLSEEKLVCVCEAGGDDTMHRLVPRACVSPLADKGATSAEVFENVQVEPASAAVGRDRSKDAPREPWPLGVMSLDPLPPPAPPVCEEDSSALTPPGSPPMDHSRNPLGSTVPSPGLPPLPPDSGGLDDIALGAAVQAAQVAQTAQTGFRLSVRLREEQVEHIDWRAGDDLGPRVEAFVAANRLRALFQEPLLARAELMVHMDRQTEVVDIVDLV